MDLFWYKCACSHYLSLAISRLFPEDRFPLVLAGGQSQCLDEDQLIIKHLFFTHFILLLFLACNLNQSDANVVDADGGAEHQVLTAMISIRANWTVSPQLRDSSHEHHLSVSLYFISQSGQLCRSNDNDHMDDLIWSVYEPWADPWVKLHLCYVLLSKAPQQT